MPNTSSILTDHERRLILVGRTGFDQQLRRDSANEIIRAADPFDAIGELAEDADPSIPVSVILGRTDNSIESLGSAEDLRRALAIADPRATVLAVEGLAATSAADATIAADASTESILDAIAQADPRIPEQSDIDQPLTAKSQSADHIDHTNAAPPETVSEGAVSPRPALDRNAATILHDATNSNRADTFGPSLEPTAADSSTSQIDHMADPTLPPSANVRTEERLVRAVLNAKPILPLALNHLSETLGATIALEHTDDSGSSQPTTTRVTVDTQPHHLVVQRNTHQASHKISLSQLEDAARWLTSWLRLEQQHTELRDAAFTDALTSAWNRRYFDRFLSAVIEKARVARVPVTILLFDIDGFKTFNDTCGHPAGDTILVETVRLLRSAIRPTDRVCRIGGDEFAVIFYEPEGPRSKDSAPPESIYDLAARFQQQICNHRFPKLEALDTTLTISGGLATYPWDGDTPERLLEAADQLLLRSKAAGKNAITLGSGARMVCKLNQQED